MPIDPVIVMGPDGVAIWVSRIVSRKRLAPVDDDGEAIESDPSHRISDPHALLDTPGRRQDDGVGCLFAIHVGHNIQLVEPDQKQSAVLIAVQALRDRMFERFTQPQPVVLAGQCVMI